MSTNLTLDNEVTMAQLCLDTTAIVENNVYEIHVFNPTAANASVFSANVGVGISALNFIKAFYGGSKGNSLFMALDEGDVGDLYYDLTSIDTNAVPVPLAKYHQHNVLFADCSGVDFTDEVMNLWKSETCANWTTCSEMAIRKELIMAHNFKDLANCNVCCSLTFHDLIAALDSAQANAGVSTTKTVLEVGDKIALSILLKQSFPGTSDVEIIIHYIIDH